MAKILIIDDEPTILELFRFVFEDAGHEVLLARNGQEALALLRELTPDFMVLDVSMPVMSGKEFILELNKRTLREARLGRIPFVVMTGENFMDLELNRVFASARGFVCYFPKMTIPEIVLNKAEEVLSKKT